MPITIAVQPYSGRVPLISDGARVDMIREAIADGTVEAALHGYTHEAVGGRGCGEFASVAEAEQRRRIRRGRQLLQKWLDCQIDVFAPPWYTYDRTTLKVLAEEGFRVISGGQSGVRTHPELLYLPKTTTQLEDVWAVAADAPDAEEHVLLVVVLHDDNFMPLAQLSNPRWPPLREAGSTFQELEALLAYLDQRPRVEVLTLGQAASKYAGTPSLHSRPAGWQGAVLSNGERLVDMARANPVILFVLTVAAPLLVCEGMFLLLRTRAAAVRAAGVLALILAAALATQQLITVIWFSDEFGCRAQMTTLALGVFGLYAMRRDRTRSSRKP